MKRFTMAMILTASLGACAVPAASEDTEIAVDVLVDEVLNAPTTLAHPEVGHITWVDAAGKHHCSGTLVRSHFMISGGHCFNALTGTDTRGGAVRFLSADGTRLVNANWTEARSFVIDGYSDINTDLAIVRLDRDIPQGDIMPALLHNGPPQNGQQAQMVGWGCTTAGDVNGAGQIKTMFTGAWPIQNKGCVGDSGGGLFVNNRLAAVIQGPNTFADLAGHRNEIEAMMRSLDSGLEMNTDRGGNDLPGSPTTVGSVAACKTSCTRNAGCRAYTFESSTGRCWLKKGAMGINISDGKISGLADRFLVGFDTPGNDITNVTTTSVDVCAERCAAMTSCNAFTLNGNTCWLKSAVGSWSSCSNCTSGVRRQFESDTDHVGGDLSNFATTSDFTCMDRCAVTEGCQAWTLNSGTCYLKSSFTDGVSAPGVKSGFRKGFDFFADYAGADLTSGTPIQLSNPKPEVCQAKCRKNVYCQAWTLNRGTGKCYLKGSIPSRVSSPGAVTGTRSLDLF